MKRKTKRILLFILSLLFLILWTFLLLVYKPERIVSFLGLKSSYLLMFGVAAIGGMSLLSTTSFYVALTTFVLGGLNVFILAIVGGLGISIGDSFYFFIGRKGEEASSGKIREIAIKISEWLKRKPKWFIPIFVFVYAGLTPLPNDVMTAIVGFSGYPYKKIAAPLIIGNIVAIIWLTFFIRLGYNLI